MMPQPQPSLAQRARSLQLRLNHGRVDPVTAANEAYRLFDDADDAARRRWLGLELQGYGNLADSRPLHVVLGVPANDRLAAHVAAYRTQRGIRSRGGPEPTHFRHFFVEALGELVAARAAIARSSGSSPIELDFGVSPGVPIHPVSGSFTRDVFERVVGGFVASLHLQVGAFLK